MGIGGPAPPADDSALSLLSNEKLLASFTTSHHLQQNRNLQIYTASKPAAFTSSCCHIISTPPPFTLSFSFHSNFPAYCLVSSLHLTILHFCFHSVYITSKGYSQHWQSFLFLTSASGLKPLADGLALHAKRFIELSANAQTKVFWARVIPVEGGLCNDSGVMTVCVSSLLLWG